MRVYAAMAVMVGVATAGCRGAGPPRATDRNAGDEATRRQPAGSDASVMPRANITQLGGSTPVEGEGTLPDGAAFYFHARGEAWEFSVAATVDEAVSAPRWRWSEPYGDRQYEAGYMSEEMARAIIESCAEMYVVHARPPVEYAGASEAEISARRLAQMIREDLRIYARDPGSGELTREALVAQLPEARQLFVERVEPAFRHVLDEEIGDLDAMVSHAALHPRWLRDAASADRVGARWAAMLRLLPPDLRAPASAQADRWFPRWTVEGAPREALLRAPR